MSTSIEGLSAEHYAELSVASAISDAVIRAGRNGEHHRTPGCVRMARQGSRPWKHRSGGLAKFTLIGTYPSRTSTIILIDSIRENVLANELRVSPAILQSGNLRTLAQRVSETGRRDTPPDKPDIRQWNLCRRAGEIRRSKTKRINVQGQSIAILTGSDDDYISLTDIARVKDVERTDYIIQNWLRNRNTIEYLGVWEQLNNPGFNPIEFDGIRNQAGLNSFVLTTKRWIERTGAVGLRSKAGRYGGTYAHKDIAFEFASWVSVEFKLYLIKEFQRLKDEENRRLSLDWNLNRTLSKLNYRIHTDAIKEHIIPSVVTPDQASFVYASEADILNVALFGQTAKQWRAANPGKEGNVREYATIEQLLVLANIEVMNAEFIRMGLSQGERLGQLNRIAINQLQVLTSDTRVEALGKPKESE